MAKQLWRTLKYNNECISIVKKYMDAYENFLSFLDDERQLLASFVHQNNISKTQSIIQKGLQQSFGNEVKIIFWDDQQWENYPLSQLDWAFQLKDVYLNWVHFQVVDYIKNIRLIKLVNLDLSLVTLQYWLSTIHIPAFPKEDALEWNGSSSGPFSISNAFNLQLKVLDN